MGGVVDEFSISGGVVDELSIIGGVVESSVLVGGMWMSSVLGTLYTRGGWSPYFTNVKWHGECRVHLH